MEDPVVEDPDVEDLFVAFLYGELVGLPFVI
jgi:hypothetical protein